ncbi:hypothetical protein VQ03_00370 [Methylobacterium tarhaniae]|uniref:Uncharacterized protein n=1 Tax=Methylobacterium tarhaniae TaxID=1187852 RepID=A0A0J6TCD9_9HYPH|nr:hypothetical protein VQ03_00370 [Methylobacterium tarhaniae]
MREWQSRTWATLIVVVTPAIRTISRLQAVCRSIPQDRAAVLRSAPSSTKAIASMRRAAGMLGAREDEARNSSALRSVRVMAIPAIQAFPDPATESDAGLQRNPPSYTLRPLA